MARKLTSPHPKWALEHKRPGTELRLIRGRYYLYEYKTVYDPERKGPRKITGKLLGSITQSDGFIPSGKRKLENTLSQTVFKQVVCKEYGVSLLVEKKFASYNKVLKKHFGNLWPSIAAIAYCRFIYRCPLKSMGFRLEQSYLPQMLGLDKFNEKTASGILKTVGAMAPNRLAYMKSFIKRGAYILMDATDVFCSSKHIALAKKGYNNQLSYDSQFNLLYLYSAQSQMPVYYRLLAGNIREVKAFKNSLLEAGLQKAVIVADKGFYSQANVDLLQAEKLKFILPLKRDSSLVSYQSIEANSFKHADCFFEHEKRMIWHKSFKKDKLTLFLFLDESLRVKEETDYLRRVHTHPEEYSIEKYHEKRNAFGTIALLTNLNNVKPSDVYQTYKSRMAIEVMFDGMKNILEADHTYMQDEQTLQGWMFINHITLQWYQCLYIELKEKGLLKRISVNDYIQLLTDVKKILINGQWHLNEVTHATRKLIKKTGFELE